MVDPESVTCPASVAGPESVAGPASVVGPESVAGPASVAGTESLAGPSSLPQNENQFNQNHFTTQIDEISKDGQTFGQVDNSNEIQKTANSETAEATKDGDKNEMERWVLLILEN